MARAAQLSDFERLSTQDQDRYAQLLQELERLHLGCRCEMVDGKDFTVTVASGYATPKFWLSRFGLT
jgi:GH18 family chitinase